MANLAREELQVYDRVLKSNLQPEEKSAVRRWVEEAMGPIAQIRVKDAPGGMLSAMRQGSENVFTALIAAYAQVNLPTGLDIGGVPVDGASGGGLLLASAFMGHSELGSDARNIGAFGFGLCAYRKFLDGFARARVASGKKLGAHLTPGLSTMAGEANDPVAQAEADL